MITMCRIRKILFIIVFVSFCFIPYVKADQSNAQADVNTAGGIQGSSNSLQPNKIEHNLFIQLRFVYVKCDKNGNCYEENIGKNYGHEYLYVIDRDSYNNGGGNYTSFVKNNKNRIIFDEEDKYISGSGWIKHNASTGNDFDNERFELDTVGGNSASDEVNRTTFSNWLDKFGITKEKRGLLTKESCDVKKEGHGKCYKKSGYRLIGELVSVRGTGDLVKIKDLANECYRFDGDNGPTDGCWDRQFALEQVMRTNHAAERIEALSNRIRVAWSDVNYGCSGKNGNNDTQCSDGGTSIACLSNRSTLKGKSNYSCGWGIWIVDTSFVARNNSDYSLDMACENCDSKNEDSKSMVIQDSTNWEDIKISSEIPDEEDRKCGEVNVNTYYKKTKDGTYCREEYHVYYPTYNKISGNLKVNLGRYFTVNASDKELDLIEENILNFAPIKVTKIRQCQGGDLNKFEESSKSLFECSNGDIIIDYKEKKDNGYSYNGKLKPYNCSYNSVNNNGVLEQKRTCMYTLNNGVYQYVDMSNGKSIKNVPSDVSKGKYKKLKISNLPVSIVQNIKEGSAIASVRFEYNLPTCDDNSKIYELYNHGGNCFNREEENPDANIYKNYVEQKPISNDSIENTACVKLYGSSGLSVSSKDSNVWKCINNRVKDKFGKCIEQNKLNGSSDYVCDFIADLCDSEEEAKNIYKVDWNPEAKNGKGECCPPGSVYTPGKGCQDKPEPICEGDDCKPVPECVENGSMTECDPGYTCNKETKKCIEEDKKKCGLLQCPDACCEEDGEVFCGEVVDGKVLCPGKPTPMGDEFNLGIYRTIDPTNPFIYQNGTVRNTGINWCNNNLNSNSCSGNSSNNMIVKTVISDKTNKSEENAMYKVTLNSNTIGAIRQYNKKHDYDDFTLKCDNNGDNCKIKGFKEDNGIVNSKLNITGKCANSNSSNFNKCGK